MSSQSAAQPAPPELEAFARFCAALELDNGEAMILEPFQRAMLTGLFGTAVETVALIPKKNGKSTTLASLALFHLATTPDAECVIAAASRDQATILYDQAAGFIRRSPGLQARFDVKRGYREIRNRRDSGRIRVLASDVDTADGVLPTLSLVDELHRHKSAELYGVFRDGLGPRNGRMFTISTAGDDEASPLGVMRTAARDLEHQTRSGAHLTAQTPDGAFVFHEWSLSDADDRNDLKLVKEANPASWQTVAALAQRHNSPSMTSWAWARFACGVWLQGEGAAIEPAEWDDLANPDIEIPKGAHVLIGLDLGWKYDTTALVPLWWKADDERVICPPIVLTPPGDGTLLDDRLIVKALLDLRDRYTIEAVVYDPNAGGQQLVQQLEREHRFTFVEHSQDNSPISLADGRFMEAIRRRDLVHTGDEQLRQQVLNAVEKPLGGDRFRFDRSKRGPRKPIDALRAVSMAHSVAVAQRDNPKRSKRLVSF